MKKKVIIPIIIGALLLIILLGVTLFIFMNNNNNNIVSTITLDINPSIELKLNNKERIVSIKPLNEDAKRIINDDLKNKTLNETLKIITENIIDKGYVNGDQTEIIVYSEGKIEINRVESELVENFKEKQIMVNVIKIEDITDDDKELAKQYNISPAKVSYIKTIIEDKEDASIEDFSNKSVNELKEIEDTNLYCDKGYTFAGGWCYKEVGSKDALIGAICPNEYVEYNGICYKETRAVESEELYCREGFKLEGNDCIDIYTYKAEVKCESGELRDNRCFDKKIVGEAYEFCRDPGRTLYDHKCLATKPTINGGCLNGDMLLNGKCVNTRDDYYMAEWKCPNGQVKSRGDGSLLDNDTHCYEEIESNNYSYSCVDPGATLNGDECTIKYIEAARREFVCKDGSIKVDGDRCINQNDTKEKIEGYYCEDDNTRLADNKCIVYEKVAAK